MEMNNRVGVSYLVVWQMDGPVIQSEVILSDNESPENMTNDDWIIAAMRAEDDDSGMRSYSLFMVIDFPSKFYV